MRLFSLCYLLGNLVLLFCHRLPNFWLLVYLDLVALGFCAVLKSTEVNIILLGLVFGMSWLWVFSDYRVRHRLPSVLEHRAITVIGDVVSLPQSSGHITKFEFYIKKVLATKVKFQGLVQLDIYGYEQKVRAGGEYQLIIKLKKPWGYANPGGFLYQSYLFMRGIKATGYVKQVRQFYGLKGHDVLRLRAWLGHKIDQSHNPNARFVKALSVGNRANLSSQDWQVLQKTGTNHLVAISGLHVGLISSLMFLLLGFLWRQSESLCLLLPAQIAAAFGAIVMAFAYSALAGFALPTQRAFIMFSVFMGGIILRRSLLPFNAWCLALLLVLGLNPLNVLDAGFWLSFAAVGFLILSLRNQKMIFYDKWVKPQWVVLLGVTPFTLYFFHQASLISPIANGLAIPFVGFLVVPCCLLSCLLFCLHLPIATQMLWLALHLMGIAWWGLTLLSKLPFASVQMQLTPLWCVVFSVMGIALLLAPFKMIIRLMGLLGFLPLLFYQPAKLVYGSFRFSLLDVGQGLASVVETRHHVLVFDTGAKYGPHYNLGQAVVVPYLQSLNIHTVNKLVISHGDNDHIGGAQSVIHLLKVFRIKTSVPNRFKAESSITSLCLAGEHWQWDGVMFRFLYPGRHQLGLDNNSSCVLRVSNRHFSVLLTGDIEASAERYLVLHQKQYLHASILVAPHHGSKTSSTSVFIQAVAPTYVLYPVGYLNRYHFPSPSVVLRYQALGVKQLSTVGCGMVSFVLGQSRVLKPLCYRDYLGFYDEG